MLQNFTLAQAFYDEGYCTPFPISSEAPGKYLVKQTMQTGSEGFHTFLDFENKKHLPFWDRIALNPTLDFEKDAQYVLILSLVIFLTRLFIGGIFWKGHLVFKSPLFRLAEKLPVSKKNYQRFSETFYLFCWHTGSFCWCVWTLYHEAGTAENPNWPTKFFTELSPRWYWYATQNEVSDGILGWPNLAIPWATRIFYLTQLSFWLSCCLLIFFEVIRRDFYLMIIHHIATCTLILFSYCLSLWRYGLIVLLVHDVADAFLYGSKCLNYCNPPPIYTDVCYAGFLIVFFIFRLVCFPLFCVFPVINPTVLRSTTGSWVKTLNELPGEYLFPTFMSILVVLHIYWFSMIVHMAYQIIKVQYIHNLPPIDKEDPRSGDEFNELSQEENIVIKKKK